MLYDVYGERRYREVQEDTWGHLKPQPKTSYKGTVLYVHDLYGCKTLLDMNFAGLDCNPWTYDDINSWVGRQKTERGFFYRWEGTYGRFKNGGYHISGKVKTIDLTTIGA